MKGLVDPTVPLKEREKVLHLYKNKKNVGEYLNKSIYIDSAGVSHNIGSDKLNNEITSSGTEYEDYGKFCYSGTATATDADGNSIAKFDTGSSEIYLNKEELVDIYESHAETGGICVDGTNGTTLSLKKNEFNSNYGPCVTDPSDINMIDISVYDTKSGSSNNFSDEKCDRKHVFSGAITKFKDSRNSFREKFSIMIDKFNELNEIELEMLNETQESIENLKKTIKEYNELYNTATSNAERKTIIDAQAKDTKIVLKHSQYNMALMGIGAIGATMLMFNYMKK